MTNSAKQTEQPQPLPPARAMHDPRAGQTSSSSTERIVWLAGGLGLLVVGWFVIFHMNHWHLTPAVFMLFVGWAAILLSARFLWVAGWTAASEGDDGDADFWKPVGARAELLAEKNSLLKAIKEIEFDHQMGKMSDKDAAAVSHYYRLRAIEVIKALESNVDDSQPPIREQIEREVRARLSVAGKTGNKAHRPGPPAGLKDGSS